MPKPLSRKYVEDYESDDGFVEDAPKSKKRKSEPKQPASGAQKDDEGNEYWELSGKRRVQVSQFKGSTMVNIREYYEKDGQTLPGKKGISMTTDQYTTFLKLIPDIERVLKSKGINVPRPQYDKATTGSKEENEEEDEEEAEESEEETLKPKGEPNKFKMKKNYEGTSEEDDG